MKPTVTTNPVANRYAASAERIVEFSFPTGESGLISFRTLDGQPRIELYRLDPGIKIVTPSLPAGSRAEEQDYHLEVYSAPSRTWVHAAVPATENYPDIYAEYRRLIDSATEETSPAQAPLGYRLVGGRRDILDVWTNGKVHP